MTSGDYTLYRLDVSYFSGKLEAYLQYKQIPFRRVEVSNRVMRRTILPNTGIAKVPILRTPEGVWLQDTTPIIDYLEARHPEGRVLPQDHAQAFCCRLLEDHADEWLWRPALHYRWSYGPDARLLGRRIAEAIADDLPIPKALAARFIASRQRRVYVTGDGVRAETREHVESIYLNTLERLEAILADRPFLLGGRPSLADFGFFASMFRHFSLDPTPGRIMRDRAPRTYAWVARMWSARHSQIDAEWTPAADPPPEWAQLLGDTAAYLRYLHANAAAWRDGRRRFDWEVDGVRYRDTPVVHYRVWCRERLQQHFDALPEAATAAVRADLENAGAWQPLWRDGRIASGLHAGGEPPICRGGGRTTPIPGRGWTAWNLPQRGKRHA